MGGGQAQSNELLLDGSPDMTKNKRVAYNPPVDAVQEIKVEAFQPDAAYGNTGGGTVNVTMKGGTNDLHGLYEFHQNQRLKATPFFTNAANQKKPVTRFNQYGLTVGGPIFLPEFSTAETRCSSSLAPRESGNRNRSRLFRQCQRRRGATAIFRSC